MPSIGGSGSYLILIPFQAAPQREIVLLLRERWRFKQKKITDFYFTDLDIKILATLRHLRPFIPIVTLKPNYTKYLHKNM